MTSEKTTQSKVFYLAYLSCFNLMPLPHPHGDIVTIPYQPSLVPYRINDNHTLLPSLQ